MTPVFKFYNAAWDLVATLPEKEVGPLKAAWKLAKANGLGKGHVVPDLEEM